MQNDFLIETNRLKLRRWTVDDAASVYKYASDSRVSELALWPTHTSVEMSREVIETVFMPNEYSLAIVLKETGEPIGCIGLVPKGAEHFDTSESEREVGYWIGYPYWNSGIMTEALEALISFCSYSLGLKSLLVTTDVRNVASQRVAEKCGFEFVTDYEYEGIPGKAFRKSLDR